MASPAESIKDLLVTASVGTHNATTGWSIKVSKEEAKPDTQITVYDIGGASPNPKFLLDFPQVQVMVRGAENGYQALYTKAKDVKDALLGRDSTTINGDVISGIIMDGDLNFLGYDENKRPRFSLNFSLFFEPAAGTNRISL